MNKRLRLIICGILVTSMFSITGCSINKNNSEASEESISSAEVTSTIKKITAETLSQKNISEDENDSLYSNNKTSITLSGSSASVEGNGVKADGSTITISESGTYTISGELNDGQIVVKASDSDKVKIILNGVTIKNSKSSAIYIESADKTIISLEDGTSNYIEDGANYEGIDDESNEPDAAIFSKDDLIISGNGTLDVKGNYKNGVTCKDDLVINSGNLNINCADDGIKGKDSVNILGGTVTVNAKGDGIKATNDSKDEKGYVYIKNGTINIASDMDGIQAENSIVILDGKIDIKSGNGSESAPNKIGGDMSMGFRGNMDNSNSSSSQETSSDSKKGLKSALSIDIEGGNINVDSYDDSIHSNDEVIINSGTINASSGDDGIHGTSTVEINGGKINISKSYEGIEGEVITINDGEVYVKSSDDGINATEGSSASDSSETQDNQEMMKNKESMQAPESKGQMPEGGQAPQDRNGEPPTDGDMQEGNGQMPPDGEAPQDNGETQSKSNDSFGGGKQGFGGGAMGGESSGNATLNINGGYLYVDADGDGLDANGSINMTGGTVIVNGPTNDGNGALDYDSNCKVTGGILIAAGSSGMLQAPDSSSTQYVISATFSNSLEAGTSVNIKSNSGENILTYTPNKKYQSIVICSPDIKKGETYSIDAGGTASGDSKDGLYTNGNFIGAKESINCTVSDIVTNAGTQNGGMKNGHGGLGGRGNKNMQNGGQTQN